MSTEAAGRLRSMTGYAQASGTIGATRWTWDLKTVNSKGLDLRLRIPPGYDALDIEARRRIGVSLTRGTCQATLTLQREAAAPEPRIDVGRLQALADAVAAVRLPQGVGPVTLDGLLGVRGVVEVVEPESDATAQAVIAKGCEDGLGQALAALVTMRESEGAALALVLRDRLETIARLVAQADAAPERRPDAVLAKLETAVAALSERHGLDPARLHAEAVLMAAKADVREELDRLAAHVTAARDLLAAGGVVGRRLDFLAQEFGREASTYCAKVNDAALTAIGLELRVEIEQFREQVQNIE